MNIASDIFLVNDWSGSDRGESTGGTPPGKPIVYAIYLGRTGLGGAKREGFNTCRLKYMRHLSEASDTSLRGLIEPCDL